ncbi:MAG: hypothetical protein LC647_00785 [Beggiatoa sp.]|nr:hypothetical protein [Beggiatoa sp.]
MHEAEKQPAGFTELFGLRNVLDSHVRFDNDSLHTSVPDEMKPRYIFISDTIILSVPLRYGEFDGLVVVVIKTIQIAHKLLEMGYLLRGSVAIGSVWHDDSNIFGTGYIDAVNSEKKANHPRILLTEKAGQHWNQSTHLGTRLSDISLCFKYGDAMIVDTLCQGYIRNMNAWFGPEDTFARYRAHIFNNLQTKAPGSSERGKWEWIAVFFNRALSQYDIQVPCFTEFPFPH